MPQFFFDVEGEQNLAGRAESSVAGVEASGLYAKEVTETIMGIFAYEDKRSEQEATYERDGATGGALRDQG